MAITKDKEIEITTTKLVETLVVACFILLCIYLIIRRSTFFFFFYKLYESCFLDNIIYYDCLEKWIYTCLHMPVVFSLYKANGPLTPLTYNHMPIDVLKSSH